VKDLRPLGEEPYEMLNLTSQNRVLGLEKHFREVEKMMLL
jgi:hypothetical protein